ncbi:MAG: hypothetical protein AAF939_05420, partial [Planctomycetota bacterium]
LTIRGILFLTFLLGFSLAALQFPARGGLGQQETFLFMAISSGFLFAASLLIGLPAVLILFSQRFHFWVFSALFLSLSLVLPVFGFQFYFVFFTTIRKIRPEFVVVPSFLTFCSACVFWMGIFTMRQFGIRLVRLTPANKMHLDNPK